MWGAIRRIISSYQTVICKKTDAGIGDCPVEQNMPDIEDKYSMFSLMWKLPYIGHNNLKRTSWSREGN